MYTEIKERNGKKYYYRVRTVREGEKFKKKRIYLGGGLSEEELRKKEAIADKKIGFSIGKNRKKEIEKLKPKIIRVLKKYKIRRAGVFGSFVRGEQKKNSDIDILADVPKNINLFSFVGIKLELEDAIGRKVDLVEYKLIRPELKKIILDEEVRII